ncbi:uncharacterized protein LY89DRAFT_13831 [Mollisia scopiformis]|uniref:Uncharacterized protein n=1 Tax=Mollisia scopiformis TaxID=149040 RepID=A0A194XVL0_MOLSC|nr:uncharacterized protein LY89DRAFT_13831 [Mollisia scopiformis]KUJ24176.1 hypothetical protein LY89DRAFT_13831 [Mollisia scopiformis]
MADHGRSEGSGAWRVQDVEDIDISVAQPFPPSPHVSSIYRSNAEIWPQRPRLEDFSCSEKRKRSGQMRFPEINVPQEHVLIRSNGIMEFSRLVSIQIEKLTAKEKRISFPIERMRDSVAKTANFTRLIRPSGKKPILKAIEISDHTDSSEPAANIQFAECLIDQDEIFVEEGKIRIMATTATKMLASSVFWIDQKHEILKSYHWLSATPDDIPPQAEDRPPRAGAKLYNVMQLIIQHLVQGRWIWITHRRVTPVTRHKWTGTGKGYTPVQTAHYSIAIDLYRTQVLYNCRKTFFSMQTVDHRMPLWRFCKGEDLNPATFAKCSLMLYGLAYMLIAPDGTKLIKIFEERLVTEIRLYQDVYSIDRSQLQKTVSGESKQFTWRGRLALFRQPRNQNKAKADNNFNRMLGQRLKLPDPHKYSYRKYDEKYVCDVEETVREKVVARRVQLLSLCRAWAKEKARHNPESHSCPWNISFENNYTDRHGKLPDKFCYRCWFLEKRNEWRQLCAVVPPRQTFWDPYHQSKDRPKGWCCCNEDACSKDCARKHRTCFVSHCESHIVQGPDLQEKLEGEMRLKHAYKDSVRENWPLPTWQDSSLPPEPPAKIEVESSSSSSNLEPLAGPLPGFLKQHLLDIRMRVRTKKKSCDQVVQLPSVDMPA